VNDTARRATVRDWLAVSGGIFGAFMAILDIQITNASLADIGGAIGATAADQSWISTGYLMAEIVVIPLTGWLASVFGLRRYLAVNSALFVLSSIGCAASGSLTQMILFRAGQGFTGGVLIPTALSIVRTRLPAERQSIGIALFGLVATLAPALGPTVGGWLTENFSWHYIFYLNIGPGIIAIALQLYALNHTEMRLSELRRGDGLGIASMAVGLSSLVFVLEEGRSLDWFGSTEIIGASITAGLGIVVFIIAELTGDRPFINLRLLASRSVGGSGLLLAVFGATAFGSLYLIPTYLALIPRYNAQQIGEVAMWAGLPQLVVLPLLPLLMRKVDLRLMVAAGLVLFAVSCFINVDLTHDTAAPQLILPQILRAFGQPLVTIPLTQLSIVGLSPRDTADASGLTNVLRNLGASIGTAMLSTTVQVREQFHFSVIADHLTQNDLRLHERLGTLTAVFGGAGHTATMRGLSTIANQVRTEAYVLAYADSFWLLGVLIIASMAAVLLLKKPAPGAAEVAGH
jgi:DHA2 family multidrug resistance protein